MDEPATTQTVALPLHQPRLPLSSLPWLIFVAGALIILLAGSRLGLPPEATHALSISFLSIVLEALPFVMLGALLGGLLEVFVSPRFADSPAAQESYLAIGVAGLLGVVIPVCECAVIAVTRRLVRKGVPFSVAVGYLLAGPIVNPIVAASTWVAYPGNWEMMVMRVLCGYGIAVLVGLIMDMLFSDSRALLPTITANAQQPEHDHHHDHEHSHDCHHDHTAPSVIQRIGHAFGHAADDFLQISQYLIVGAFFAGISQTLIPRASLVALADSTEAAIASMMGLAVALNLCSEADAFVAASFRTVMPPAAMLAFLVLGPMLDIKLIAMYLSFVRKRALIVLIILLCASVFVLMQIVHAIYGPELLGARG
jgi:uncharacterized membrane protein YraQ (UPF0718 family)